MPIKIVETITKEETVGHKCSVCGKEYSEDGYNSYIAAYHCEEKCKQAKCAHQSTHYVYEVLGEDASDIFIFKRCKDCKFNLETRELTQEELKVIMETKLGLIAE